MSLLSDDIWNGLSALQEAIIALEKAKKKLKIATEQLPQTLQRDGNVPADLETVYQLLKEQVVLSYQLLETSGEPLPRTFTELNKIRNLFRLGWARKEGEK